MCLLAFFIVLDLAAARLVFVANRETVANPAEIFDRDLEEICNGALKLYATKYEKCAFRFPGGRPCTSRLPQLHQQHTSPKGNIEPGPFQHGRRLKGNGSAGVQQQFVETYEAIFSPKAGAAHDPSATAEKR